MAVPKRRTSKMKRDQRRSKNILAKIKSIKKNLLKDKKESLNHQYSQEEILNKTKEIKNK